MIVMAAPDTPEFVELGTNLASADLGARAISASDEFFAPLSRMLLDSDAVFYPDRFDDNGKWMDGWETRRRRDGNHDHCIIALATDGRLLGFDIDTSHFTGNYAPAARIEACVLDQDPDENTTWVEILPTVQLGPDAHHYFDCKSRDVWSHLRIHIYPDGGIARLRVYGVPQIDMTDQPEDIDLASSLNGGRVIALSDAHYGDYRRLLAPGRGLNMGDGWETRRRREPGHDWLIVSLGTRGRVHRIEVDTAYFKGNYPDSCSLRAADLSNFGARLSDAIVTASMFWETIVPNAKLQADHIHVFDAADITDIGPVTHVRINIHPDGGVSRLRIWGTPE